MDDASSSQASWHVLAWPSPGVDTASRHLAPDEPPGDSPGRLSDAALLDRCRHGDPDAWDALVARHETLVHSVACSAGLPADEASDVTQATFLALLKALSSLRDEDRLASWLVTVAVRHAHRARARLDREDPAGLRPGRAAPELETELETELEWQRVVEVRDAVERLDPRCRALLDALYFDPEHPPYTVVARRMGYAVGTLGPMRARCLARLRGLLGEDDLR